MGLLDHCLRPRPRISAVSLQLTSATWPPGAAAVEALTPFGCRFPIGEVASDGFRFCGLLRERGSYCAKHRRLAYAGLVS